MTGIDITAANERIRKCVHCGFCTATCPTYLVTGDELDSPRGRIWLMKDMLANRQAPPSPRAVHHIDRCLSCLSCTTTCPSGVDYMHLVDAARVHIENNHRRAPIDRLLRALLPALLTRRGLLRWMLRAGRLVRPLAPLLPARFAAMLAMVPDQLPPPGLAERRVPLAPSGERTGRVILHLGCVQPVLRPAIDDAALRLLARHGVDVLITRQSSCCGALDHHLGRETAAAAHARANIIAWEAAAEAGGPVDAIIVTASGCGTVIKDYAALFGDDPAMAARAGAIAGQARDISEYLATLPPLPARIAPGVAVAWHSACSLQHGQQIKAVPRQLLVSAGFDVRDPAEAHICCGSAGSYAILQPEMSGALQARKQAALAATGARIVASSNIGCLGQIATPGLQTVHMVELLDWASGGPRPAALAAAIP